VRLSARDDGRGADSAAAGNGLRGMRERLECYGGEVEVETAPGQGFALRIRLPLVDAGLTPEDVRTDATQDDHNAAEPKPRHPALSAR
jgi:signal transduction histidine kinase